MSGPGGLAKVGGGSSALTGANLSRPHQVNQGTLALGPGGSLNNSPVTVGNGTSASGILQVNGNYAIGGDLTVSGGSSAGQGGVTFNPAEANTSVLTVGGAMTLGGGAGNPALSELQSRQRHRRHHRRRQPLRSMRAGRSSG